MTHDEVQEFIRNDVDRYIAERIQAGDSPNEARRMADDQMGTLFRAGKPGPGQLLFVVLDDEGSRVGILWIGPLRAETSETYWIWNVEIEEPYRRRGLGRAAMILAEEVARAHGATKLGLNVLGHNSVARQLYESMGYSTMAINMRKQL